MACKEFDALKALVTIVEKNPDGPKQLEVKRAAAKELLVIQDRVETVIAKKHGLSGPHDNAFSQYDKEVQADSTWKKAAAEGERIGKEVLELSQKVEAAKAAKAKVKPAKAALDKVIAAPNADKKLKDEVLKYYQAHKTALDRGTRRIIALGGRAAIVLYWTTPGKAGQCAACYREG
jgi:hypothetical protein